MAPWIAAVAKAMRPGCVPRFFRETHAGGCFLLLGCQGVFEKTRAVASGVLYRRLLMRPAKKHAPSGSRAQLQPRLKARGRLPGMSFNSCCRALLTMRARSLIESPGFPQFCDATNVTSVAKSP